MNRTMAVVALSGAMVMGARALAADPVNQSTVSKRQMYAQVIDCMKKRMSANKNSSYNEAMKACKVQIKERSNSPAGALVASDTPPAQR